MKLSRSEFVIAVVGFLVPTMGFSVDSPTVSPPTAAWAKKMRVLERTLSQLLIDISSDDRFNDKRNFKAILKNANELSCLAHTIKSKAEASPDKDLSLRLVGSDFSTEMAYATKSLEAGHRAYARVILNSITSYCIACHTRTGSGPQFSGAKLDPKLESLTPLAKGNYFVATRDFDRAFTEYKKLASDQEKAVSQPFEYERALRAGLSVAVRVKRDPDLALELLKDVTKNDKAPYYLREQAGEWQKSLTEWKAEKPVPANDLVKLFSEANRLVLKARSIQKFPADRSADIVYLRASAVVHDLLGLSPKGEMASNAFYLAGVCYDILYDYGVKDFSEFYYRSCVRTSPHTAIAKECYRRYEESVYFGYTGSGGTFIPSDVRARLNELELLSSPAEAQKANAPQMQ